MKGSYETIFHGCVLPSHVCKKVAFDITNQMLAVNENRRELFIKHFCCCALRIPYCSASEKNFLSFFTVSCFQLICLPCFILCLAVSTCLPARRAARGDDVLILKQPGWDQGSQGRCSEVGPPSYFDKPSNSDWKKNLSNPSSRQRRAKPARGSRSSTTHLEVPPKQSTSAGLQLRMCNKSTFNERDGAG